MAVVLRIDYIMLSGEQVDAVKLGGVVVNACEREERRRNIDERNRIRAPAGGHSGNAQHERDRRRRREHGALAHIAIVAEAFAVIRYKEDRRVVIHTAAAQRVGYAGDLVVNERNAGVIEVFKLQRVEVGYAEAVRVKGFVQQRLELAGVVRYKGSGQLVRAVELVPRRGRAERRVRVYERGHEKDRLFRVAVFNELDRAVAYPLRRVRFGGELRYLRYVVHLAALTVVVENVGIIFFNIFRVVVLRVRHLLLRVAARKAE